MFPRRAVTWSWATIVSLLTECPTALSLQPTRNTTSSGAWRRVNLVPWTCLPTLWRSWSTSRLNTHFETRSVTAWPLHPSAPLFPLPWLLNLLLSPLSCPGYLLRGCLLPDRQNRLYFGAGRYPAALQAGCVPGCSLLRAPGSPGCGRLLWFHCTISLAHLGPWGLSR